MRWAETGRSPAHWEELLQSETEEEVVYGERWVDVRSEEDSLVSVSGRSQHQMYHAPIRHSSPVDQDLVPEFGTVQKQPLVWNGDALCERYLLFQVYHQFARSDKEPRTVPTDRRNVHHERF